MSDRNKVFMQQDPKAAQQLGDRWQDAIMDLCDDELLFTQARCLSVHVYAESCSQHANMHSPTLRLCQQ